MLKRSIRLVTTLLVVSSCASIQRPNVDVGIVNAPGKRVKYYNLERDYDADGKLKPGAVPTYRPFAKLEDLNKRLCLDSDAGPEEAIARFKAYVRNLREAYERDCKPPAGR